MYFGANHCFPLNPLFKDLQMPQLRLGRTHRGLHGKRCLVTYRKSPLHRASLPGPDCTDSNRQHICSLLHQQGGRYDSDSLCALETSVLVSPQRNSSEVSAHSRTLECNGRQACRRSQVTRQSGPYLRFSTSGAQDGPGHVWSFFAIRFSPKLPKFISPVPDPTAWAVDALSPPWESLDVYTFPPVSLFGHMISKVMDQGYHRMVLIAPGWSNMTWFGDLVSSVCSDPFQASYTKDLVTQPFDRLLHWDLGNLNLHVWLLEPLSFRNKGSMKK